MAQGWGTILETRLTGLVGSLANFAVLISSIILLPLIPIGAWARRHSDDFLPYLLFFAILLVSGVIAATGFAFVLVALVRFAGNQVTTSDTDGARAAAIYWHFVVLSWLLAALAVYVFQHK